MFEICISNHSLMSCEDGTNEKAEKIFHATRQEGEWPDGRRAGSPLKEIARSCLSLFCTLNAERVNRWVPRSVGRSAGCFSQSEIVLVSLVFSVTQLI